MSRSEASTLVQPNEAMSRTVEADHNHNHEPVPMIFSISRAERTFRWMSSFRNEPRFELATVRDDDDPNTPDRAA